MCKDFEYRYAHIKCWKNNKCCTKGEKKRTSIIVSQMVILLESHIFLFFLFSLSNNKLSNRDSRKSVDWKDSKICTDRYKKKWNQQQIRNDRDNIHKGREKKRKTKKKHNCCQINKRNSTEWMEQINGTKIHRYPSSYMKIGVHKSWRAYWMYICF